jgi:hypothetical protein|tara:strand:- start:296 stop:529 length:234 start_codon:yes stop_codon:yes gene_type:complete
MITFKQLKKLIEDNSNDMMLGASIRKVYWNIVEELKDTERFNIINDAAQQSITEGTKVTSSEIQLELDLEDSKEDKE